VLASAAMMASARGGRGKEGAFFIAGEGTGVR
jgi:hypothetical protein